MRRARVDGNQTTIVKALRDAGCVVCGRPKGRTVHEFRRKTCGAKCGSVLTASKNGLRYYKARKEIADKIQAVVDGGGNFKQAAEELNIAPSRVTLIAKEFGISAPSYTKRGECPVCGAEFFYSPSTNRRFCSYDCHLKSGGAKRAGNASAMARLKYGAKKDANHKEVIETIRVHTAVHDLSNAGFGCPDGLAWINDGWQLFDIKNPKTGYGRRGLNPIQKKWADDWRGGPVYLIYSVEEAERFARGDFEGIKVFPEDWQ